jgi:dTDP-4-amino-4,6-dideoxygalactose transaminase
MMQVPLLDLRRQLKSYRDDAIAAMTQVVDEQSCVLGPHVKRFEEEVATYCSVPHVVGCASGTDALLLALRALGVGDGEEVVTTPYTFFATAGAIVNARGRPVFVDIERDTFNIDAAQIEDALSSRTRVILPVHLYGQCADMDAITAIAATHDVSVIEDAAQAIGAEDKGRRAGSMGDIGTFSFYPSKNLGGFGDGGVMSTRDEALDGRLRALRNHGGARQYFHDTVGWNSRLDAVQAAVLSVKLKLLDGWTAGRQSNAAHYDEALAGLDGLTTPVALPDKRHIYNQYIVRSTRRDELLTYLRENGVGCAIYYPLSLHLQPCFAALGYRERQFPEAEEASQTTLSIPVNPDLTDDERDYVVETIRAFHGE